MKNCARFGIVGLGFIGQQHARQLLEGRAGRAQLAAVATERNLDLPESVLRFNNVGAMLASGTVDVVLVATPHPTHQVIAEQVLLAGGHLLLEKPVASRLDEAQEIDAVARSSGRLFGVMHQLRMDPLYQYLREKFQRGDWGGLLRFAWTATDWYRHDAYYKSVPWRATWAGEGGGLLVNQCVHDLDLITWIFGLPNEVSAFVDFGKHHPIETEDEVLAVLSYAGGKRGTFLASTGEAPGVRRIELVCEKALIIVEGRKMTINTLAESVAHFSRTSTALWAKPACKVEVLEFPVPESPHAHIMANFAEAVLTGTPLLAPGSEGLASVELANACLLSAWEKNPVTQPLDVQRYIHRFNLAGRRQT